MVRVFTEHIIEKPDKNYLKWVFPQNKNVLLIGLTFTLVTVTALSFVDYFYYAEAFYNSLGEPSTKPFGFTYTFRLIIVPFVNLMAIVLVKSNWVNSMKRLETLGGIVIFISLIGLLGTGISTEYYSSDDYTYEALVLILFSQLILGLSCRTSFIFGFIILCSVFVYSTFDDIANEIYIYNLTLTTLVWIPVLLGSLKLEEARFFNFNTISKLKESNTKIEEAREEVEQQKRLLRAGETVSRMASWSSSKDLSQVSYSDGIYDIYEVDKNEVAPEDIFQLTIDRMHPEDRKRTLQDLSQLQNGVIPPVNEHRILLPDGRIKWLKVMVGNKNFGKEIYGATQDITREMKLKIELQKNAAELKIKNEDLQQFAYASSHDLQEPLRTISNFVSILDKKLSTSLSE